MNQHIRSQINQYLSELWKNAIFDIDSYILFESFIKFQSKQHNPQIINPKSIINADFFNELVSIRNRNLISHTEQRQLRSAVIAFFGLSVGSQAAITWSLLARPHAIKIVDHDVVDVSNLNRLIFSTKMIGQYKTNVTKKIIKQISPYTSIITSRDGSQNGIKNCLFSSPQPQIIVDAIDDLEGKLYLREFAQQLKLPLISAVDVGDNVILDIERYDRQPYPQMFLGRIKPLIPEELTKMSPYELKKIIIKLVGFESNDEKMLNSLGQIGSALATWPQLGSTAKIAGGVITTTIKKILLGEDVRSGRYHLDLDKLLDKSFTNSERVDARNRKIRQLNTKFKLSEK